MAKHSSAHILLTSALGYLACNLFLTENHELGIMLINTLQRDLKSQNYLDKCAALNAICYIDHTEMLDNVLDLVIQTMDFPKQIVRKKAVAALYFLYEKSSIDIERIEEPLRKALEDMDLGVVFSALSVWKNILLQHASKFEDMLPRFHAIHRQIMERRIHKSFIYHGVYAPWAQLECLEIYKIYQNSSIGSPRDFYKIIMECIQCVEKKVDAAFAIILECIKLLASIDSLLLSTLSVPEENPFEVLVPYLASSNHNLKYLGLLGISFIDETFWKKDWLDGTLLASIIESSHDDYTIIAQSVENLDAIVDDRVLRNVSPKMTEAMSQNYDNKQNNTTIAYWLINRIIEYNTEPDSRFVETILLVLAESRKNLNEDYLESKCSLLKNVLTENTENSSVREIAVNTSYSLLSKANSEARYSPLLLQLMIWMLGENGYLSSNHTDLDIMRELQKWIQLVQDEYLQTCGLQAIKQCIMRCKKWLSGLDAMLREYKRSAVPEKQEISKELLVIISNDSFEKEFQEISTSQAPTEELFANPNRPKTIGKYTTGTTKDDQYFFHTGHKARNCRQSSPCKSNDSLHPKTKASNSASFPIEPDLVSSLIDLELQDDEDEILSTSEFGQLWVQYSVEKKLKFECSITRCDILAKKLSKTWQIRIIQVIGQEFIAVAGAVLIHIAMLPNHQFELTLRSAQHTQQVAQFLSKIQL
ncbi:adaptin N terminal region-domain-containing protein [Parasitella parasitica]|nr:adaptin N terminal region-domain-containing protein [Parasitella parasitica]